MDIDRRTFAGAALSLLGVPAAGANAAGGSERFARVSELLSHWIEQGKLPNASVLVTHRGSTLYTHHAGWSDVSSRTLARADDLFRIYSMTKPITAALAMTLVDEGRIRPDDPVAAYVPEFGDLRVWTEGGAPRPVRTPMTIRHLLTHTSGLSYSFQTGTPVAKMYDQAGLKSGQWYHDPRFPDLATVARALASIPLAHEPGEHWHYGMSLEIVGLIVERVLSRPLAQVFAERIFEPLGMIDTAFQVPPDKAHRLAGLYMADPSGGLRLIEPGARSPFLKRPTVTAGSGGLVSTLQDYGRFASMLAGAGTYGSHRILSKRVAGEMMRDHLPIRLHDEMRSAAKFGYGGSGAGMGFGYGGAVMIDTGPMGGLGSQGAYGWGGGASTTFWADPSRDLAVVFMTQLLPSGSVPVHDLLHRAVYGVLSG
jgi:CubicO group peptidase (beta-lactamase class C family)